MMAKGEWMEASSARDRGRVFDRWCEYARPRFSPARALVEWDKLSASRCPRAWAALADEVQAHGGRLRFGRTELLLAVVSGLEAACEYCGEYFGVESWGVVRRNPLRGNPERCDFSVASVAVCCADCSQAHKRFTDAQYRDVLAALRRCDPSVVRSAVAALAKGTPPAPGPASNAKRPGIR
jgi:hypothetical protein